MTPTREPIAYENKIKFPFVPLPKVWRWLSYEDDDGNRTRFDPYDLALLAVLLELDETFKTDETLAVEACQGETRLKKSKANLQRVCIETGAPLIICNEWRDKHGYRHCTIELGTTQEQLGKRFDEIYDPETGEAVRVQWLSLFDESIIEKFEKQRAKTQGRETTLAFQGRGSRGDLGQGRQATLKETKRERDQIEKEKKYRKAPKTPPNNSPAKAVPSIAPEALRLSSFFFELIVELDPKAKKPNMNKWAQELERMHRIDNRTWDEIRSLIKFAHEDEFWQSNIMSPKKLRVHQTRLIAQMAKSKESPASKSKEDAERFCYNREYAMKREPDLPKGSCSVGIRGVMVKQPSGQWSKEIGYGENGFKDQWINAMRKAGWL